MPATPPAGTRRKRLQARTRPVCQDACNLNIFDQQAANTAVLHIYSLPQSDHTLENSGGNPVSPASSPPHLRSLTNNRQRHGSVEQVQRCPLVRRALEQGRGAGRDGHGQHERSRKEHRQGGGAQGHARLIPQRQEEKVAGEHLAGWLRKGRNGGSWEAGGGSRGKRDNTTGALLGGLASMQQRLPSANTRRLLLQASVHIQMYITA